MYVHTVSVYYRECVCVCMWGGFLLTLFCAWADVLLTCLLPLLPPSSSLLPPSAPPLTGLARRVSIYLDRSKQGGECCHSLLSSLSSQTECATLKKKKKNSSLPVYAFYFLLPLPLLLLPIIPSSTLDAPSLHPWHSSQRFPSSRSEGIALAPALILVFLADLYYTGLLLH